MKRRDFLKYSVLTGIVLSSNPLSAENNWTIPHSAKSTTKNWIWTGVDKKATDEDLKKRFEMLKSKGITGLFIGGDDERYFKLAKAAGLDTHIWMWTMNRRDKVLMENHPEYYAINRKGESCHDQPPYVDYYRWLCPSKPEVLEYLKGQVKTLVDRPYIDGIHLDYVRYCDVILPRDLWEKYDLVQKKELPEFDYCYCDTCCSKFKKEHGVSPKELKDPSKSKAWKQFRYDSITNIVNALAKLVHDNGKTISAAVFPSPSIAKKLVRQDWVQWDLDMIFPMLYQSFYRKEIPWIGRAAKEGIRKLDGKFPLYAGLYLPALKEPEDLAKALKYASKAGAKGVSLFGKVSEEHWQAFEQANEAYF